MNCSYCDETARNSIQLPQRTDVGERDMNTKKDPSHVELVRFCPKHWDWFVKFINTARVR